MILPRYLLSADPSAALIVDGATIGTPITLSVATDPNEFPSSDTITFSDGGGGGTFTPSTLAFDGSHGIKTVVYENATLGTYTITATSEAGGLVFGSPVSVAVRDPDQPGVKVWTERVAPGLIRVWYERAPALFDDVFTPSDGGVGGYFSPTSLTFPASDVPVRMYTTYTPRYISIPITFASTQGSIIPPTNLYAYAFV